MFTTPHLLGAQNSSCIGKQLSFRHCSTLSEHTKTVAFGATLPSVTKGEELQVRKPKENIHSV
jgi:hypothetical protein